MIGELMDLTVLVQGLCAGCIYALAGISINILYRPTNAFNFAQGDLIMIGAMICAVLLNAVGLSWIGAALIATVAVVVVALVEDIVAVAPILRRPRASVGWIITTLAVSLVLQDLVGKLAGPDPMMVRPPWPLSVSFMEFGSMRISSYQIAIFVFTGILVIATEMFYKTRTGKAVRAVAEDREASLLRGINPVRLARVSFMVSGAVAALTGIIAGPLLYASIALGPILLIRGFEVAAVGGIGSNRGAIVGGLILGVVEAAAAVYLSPGYQGLVTFSVVLLILLIRPVGLFGSTTARVV